MYPEYYEGGVTNPELDILESHLQGMKPRKWLTYEEMLERPAWW